MDGTETQVLPTTVAAGPSGTTPTLLLSALRQVQENVVLYRSSLPKRVRPPSIKKYRPSDFCAYKTSDVGFLPRTNPGEITEARGKLESQALFKSENPGCVGLMRVGGR